MLYIAEATDLDGAAQECYGGQRVAMRRVDDSGGDVVYYLHTDHLGSTSLATDESKQKVPDSRTLYYPYREVRWPTDGSSTLSTDLAYTDQRDAWWSCSYDGS